MRREWEPEELIACWTLVERDRGVLANKAGATRLGFALLLKFFELEGRFPQHAGELPPAAVDYIARQVGVAAADLGRYDWTGRSIKYHRAHVRAELGFREATREDEQRLIDWLADEICPMELGAERQREELLQRCRQQRLEPPGRTDRILGAARRAADERFCATTVARLPEHVIARLEELVTEDAEAPVPGVGGAGGGRSLLAELKADPGRLGLESLLAEIAKLERVRAIWPTDGLFADATERRLAAWRARAAGEHPAWLRAHPREVRLTLLAALCWSRLSEITDGLIDLLIALVHRINARAERRVEGELIADLRRVRGKQSILFAMAEVAVEHPNETVRAAIYPVVGEQTLRDLVREAHASDHAFRARVRTVLRSSYSRHYRRMLPRLLDALQFRCNNAAGR